MNYITVADLSPKGFVRLGWVAVPLADGRHGPGEADCFIELAHRIWHLGPYFAEPLRLAVPLAFAT